MVVQPRDSPPLQLSCKKDCFRKMSQRQTESAKAGRAMLHSQAKGAEIAGRPGHERTQMCRHEARCRLLEHGETIVRFCSEVLVIHLGSGRRTDAERVDMHAKL